MDTTLAINIIGKDQASGVLASVKGASEGAASGLGKLATGSQAAQAAAADAGRALAQAGQAAQQSGDAAEESGGSWLNLGNILGSVAGGLGKLALAGGAGALAGLVGIGAAGVAAWGDYDAALDTVMQKTGITGDALEGMGASIQQLSGSTAGVGTDMAHIGEVMADLSVRTGATGATLDGLTTQMLHLQQVQGEGAVSAANFGRLLGDWAVPAEQGAGLMDELFTASQKFGVSTDSLAGKLVQFGSPLRQMGFDLDTSIALFGQFEQQGVNTELVLGSLRIAAGKFADAGVPLKQGLGDAITRIHDMKDGSQALAAAMHIFGARAGPDMAAAIREGKFSLDDAVASLQGYEGSIQSAAQGAMDFPDQWAMGMNQVKAALVPVGQAVMDLGSAAMPVLQVGFDLATGAIGSFASGLSMASEFAGMLLSGGISLSEALQALSVPTGVAEAILGIADAAGQVGPRVASLQAALSSLASGNVIGFVSGLASAFGLPLDSTMRLTAAAISMSNSVQSAVSQVVSVVQGVLGSAFHAAGAVAQVVLGGLPALISAVSGPVSTIASLVGSTWGAAFQAAGSIIQSVLGILPGLAQTGMGVLTSLAGMVSSVLAAAFQVLAPIAQSVFAGIATVVQMAMPGVLALVQALGGFLAAAFDTVKAVGVALFTALQPYVPALQAAIGQLAQWVGGVLAGAFTWLAGFISETVVPALTVLGGWLAAQIPVAVQFLAGVWTGVLQPAIAAAWGFIQGNLLPLFGQLVDWLQAAIPAALAALSGFWQQHGDQILSIARSAWDTIQSVIDSVLGTITGLWQAFQSAREGDWRGFGEKLRAIWDASWEAVKTVISTVGPQIVSALQGLATDAQAKFTAIDWPAVGRAMVEGIANGIRAGAAWVGDAARGAAQAALDAAKGLLGIHSPSTVMAAEVGVPMAQGLAVGFANGLDGSALPAIVGGVRSLMERIGAVIAGVGDSVSMGDWEDLAGPVGKLNDMMKSLGELGKALAGGDLAANWSAAQGQVAGLVGSARAILTQLAPLLAGMGDAVSRADWEDFAGPLKLLADSLAAIAHVSKLFGEETAAPSLAGLSGPIRQLAVDARALLVELDSAIQPVSSLLPAKLKDLGDAAAGARAVADGALGLVKSLQEALTADWAALDWPAAGQMMHDLAGMVLWFAQKSEEASVAIQRVDTSGLAPLKDAASNLIGIADGAQALVERLTAALKVDWGAVHWSDAGRMMRDLALMVAFFATRASEAALGLKDVDISGLAPLKATAESLLGIADGARAIVTKLVDALSVDWGAVQWPAAGQMMYALAHMAAYFVTKASEAALAIHAIDTSGLAPLNTAAQAVLSIVETTRSLWDALAASLTFDWSAVPFDLMLIGLDSLTVKAAQLVAGASRASLGILTVDTAGLAPLNAAIGALDSIVSATTSVWAGLASALSFDWSTTPFDRMLIVVDSLTVKAALLVAYAARAALGILAVDTSGLAPLNTALDSLGGVADKTIGLFQALSAKDFPDLALFGVVKTRLETVMRDALALANAAALAVAGTLIVNPVMAGLGRALGEVFSAAKNALDLRALLGGTDFPTFDLAVLRQRLAQALAAGKALADEANRVLGQWDTTVKDSLTHLGAVLKDSLDAATTTLDLQSLLGGKVFPVFDVALLRARLAAALTAGKELADEADRVLATWDVKVKDSLSRLGAVLKGSLEAATTTLDLNALLGGAVAPVFDIAVLKQRLAQALSAGKDLSDEADRALAEWDIKVNESLTHLGAVLKSSLEAASAVLDFSDLQSRLLTFRGFDMRVLGPKIDLLIASAIAVAQEFGQRAAASPIKDEWAKAGAALKALFGDAASTLTDALDLGAALLDPQTQIPSLGQVQAKLDALFGVVVGVAQQFAARAANLAANGVDTSGAAVVADQVKAVFESLSTVADTVEAFAGLYLGSSGFNNIQAVLGNVFGMFANFAGQADAVNAVSAAATSMLGGLQAMVGAAGYTAGTTWAEQFAAGLAAATGSVTDGARRALVPLTGGSGGGGGTGPVVNNTYHTTYNNTLNLSVDSANAEAVTLNFNLLEAMSGA